MIIKQQLHVPAFLLLLVAVYGASLYAASTLAMVEAPALVADAVTADLVLLVPLLYYLLLVRGRGWPTITVAPVFLASLLAASLVVPAEHDRLLAVLRLLVAPIELLVLGFVGYQTYRLTQGIRQAGREADGDVLETLRAAARRVLDNRFVAGALAFEIAVFYYAFLWTKPRVAAPGRSFSHHRKVGYGAVLATVMAVGGIEVFAVHLLVQRWSTTAAWLLTAVSIYGLVWLLGDYQAIRRRPIRVTDDGLDIRLGIRWSVRIPWQAVATVRPVGYSFTAPKRPDYLNVVVLGAPRYVVDLEQALVASGPYGIEKQVVEVGFTIDDRDSFEETLKQYL